MHGCCELLGEGMQLFGRAAISAAGAAALEDSSPESGAYVSGDYTSALASVALTVVAGGKVAVLGGDGHGWARGSGGTWERGAR